MIIKKKGELNQNGIIYIINNQKFRDTLLPTDEIKGENLL